MAKITERIKEFWESNKKPDYLKISDTKNDDVKVVKFVNPKFKKTKTKQD